ncbi:MAG TPA: TetR/AcrR family transcriptional regulator, partial [Salinisphaeraceae bacterium]|nr:TetR/AcrR family transcriptional regulator [Salinisphaeraceae bacterium]
MDTPEVEPFAALLQVPGRSAHDRLLNAACQLFYQHGINAIGVDTIIEQAGVAKMSLYRIFGSKSALVAAYLEHRDAYWQHFFQRRLLSLDIPAAEKLLLYFDLLDEWFQSPGFCGCAFINAEAQQVTDATRTIIARHKANIRELLQDLAAEAGIEECHEL